MKPFCTQLNMISVAISSQTAASVESGNMRMLISLLSQENKYEPSSLILYDFGNCNLLL